MTPKKPREAKGRGRPPIMLLCVSVHHQGDRELRTSAFPTQATAAFKSCCKTCSKLERKEYRANTPAREKEAREAERLARLRESPQMIDFARELDARMQSTKTMNDVAAFFEKLYVPPCECCHELSTGQDTIGLRTWCTLCGWGIERTGRCLAHPGGEVFYPGLSAEGVTLPAELLVMMRAPAGPPQEAPTREPGDENLS